MAKATSTDPLLNAARLTARLRQEWRQSVAHVTEALDRLESAVDATALGFKPDITTPLEVVMQRLHAHVALIHGWCGDGKP